MRPFSLHELREERPHGEAVHVPRVNAGEQRLGKVCGGFAAEAPRDERPNRLIAVIVAAAAVSGTLAAFSSPRNLT